MPLIYQFEGRVMVGYLMKGDGGQGEAGATHQGVMPCRGAPLQQLLLPLTGP